MRTKTRKEERIGLRLSARMRFGLGLLARKYRVSESEMVSRCIETALEQEGWTGRDFGELFSRFDAIWNTHDGPARAAAIAQLLPEIATDDEKRLLEAYKKVAIYYEQKGDEGEECGIPMQSEAIFNAIADYLNSAPGGLSQQEYEKGLFNACEKAVIQAQLSDHPNKDYFLKDL